MSRAAVKRMTFTDRWIREVEAILSEAHYNMNQLGYPPADRTQPLTRIHVKVTTYKL